MWTIEADCGCFVQVLQKRVLENGTTNDMKLAVVKLVDWRDIFSTAIVPAVAPLQMLDVDTKHDYTTMVENMIMEATVYLADPSAYLDR